MDEYLYAGNMPFDVTEDILKEFVGTAGTVKEVRLAKDPELGLFRGFAFVHMGSAAEVQKAITELNGKLVETSAPRECFLQSADEVPDLWESVFGTTAK